MKKEDENLAKIASQQGLEHTTEFEDGLGITRQYTGNRSKLWDSASGKQQYKEKVFGEHQTVRDEITGNVMHKSHAAAKRKYHMKNAEGETVSSAYAKHAAETDHIVPIKNLHERTKGNPFLSDGDLKEIVNKEHNYRVIPKSLNAAKGEKTNLQLAFDPNIDISLKGRAVLVGDAVKSEMLIAGDLAARTAKNAGTIFAEGAKDSLAASAIPLVIRGTQDLVRVGRGELTWEEAAEDVGTLGASIAASGGAMRTVTFALSETIKNGNDTVLKQFAEANQIGTILVVGSVIAKAAGKYLNGEVDARGFFSEIGESGLSMISGMLASKAVSTFLVGGIIVEGTTAAATAPVLAAMIASAACSEIFACAQKLEEEKRSNQEIRIVASQARAGIQQQQEELKKLLEQGHEVWVQEMTDIFQTIADGIIQTDITRTNQGLRRLMVSFDRDLHLYGESDSPVDDLIAVRAGTGDMRLLRQS